MNRAMGNYCTPCGFTTYRQDLPPRQLPTLHRMSSGSYFPPPVRAVEIPKPHGGGTRILGVPTVGDRIAQTVVAARLEQKVEPIFHPDSYGYRPGRSALDAVGTCRARSWKIRLDHRPRCSEVFRQRVVGFGRQSGCRAHRSAVGVAVCETVARRADTVVRWHPAATEIVEPHKGSAISPVLANLFLHYAFDAWMARNFPDVPFERFADDAVVHCVSQQQAEQVRAAIEDRMVEVGLRLHPDKTKIVCVPRAQRERLGCR